MQQKQCFAVLEKLDEEIDEQKGPRDLQTTGLQSQNGH